MRSFESEHFEDLTAFFLHFVFRTKRDAQFPRLAFGTGTERFSARDARNGEAPEETRTFNCSRSSGDQAFLLDRTLVSPIDIRNFAALANGAIRRWLVAWPIHR
jgi:hypothetical protein